MKKLLLSIAALAFIVAASFQASAWFNVGMVGGGVPAGGGAVAQDFTTYTEVDPNAELTVAENSVSWTDFDTRAGAPTYVYKDFTAGYFGGDFTHQFVIVYSGVANGPVITYWALSDTLGDWLQITGGTADAVRFGQYTNQLRLQVVENGSGGATDSYDASAGTTYYITVTRDDDGGANSTGLITAYIRTGSHSGTLVDTLSVDCSVGEQNNYRYLIVATGYDQDQASHTISGSISTLTIE